MEMLCNDHAPIIRGGCPDKCKGAGASQWRITDDQLNRISTKAQEEIAGSRGDAFICSYCGCCYIRRDVFTRRLGMLIAGCWYSALFPIFED
jgi:hypothetical protein